MDWEGRLRHRPPVDVPVTVSGHGLWVANCNLIQIAHVYMRRSECVYQKLGWDSLEKLDSNIRPRNYSNIGIIFEYLVLVYIVFYKTHPVLTVAQL